MTKRVSDFSDNECIDLFQTLPLPQKRQLLQIYDPTDARLFRDVLHIIAPYLSIQTWARLKQCCKVFHSALVLHPMVVEVRDILGLPPNILPDDKTRILFFPYVRRLLYFLKDLDDRTHQNLIEEFFENDTWDNEYRLRARTRMDLDGCLLQLKRFHDKKWFPILGFRICFPHGFVCPEDSFRSIGNIYFDPLENMFEISKYGNIVTKHAKRIDKQWYEHCKLYMEFINRK